MRHEYNQTKQKTIPMSLRIVQSKQNTRLKELRRALSKPPRAAGELAGIEGPNLIEEAVRAKLGMETVFVAQDSERLLETLTLPPETEVLLMPRELLNSALTTEAPQPIAALVQQPLWTWSNLLQDSAFILVLAGLQDPGNLGTIVRSAEAFGATGIVSLPGTVSEWNPKAVRASAGSIFRVPLISASADECIAQLRKSGVKLWTTALKRAEPAPNVNLTQPVAILIGNEGNGVPQEIAVQADGALTIPCPGPVESLNAAIATSVLLYEAARQRATVPASLQRSGSNARSAR
jgi:RNA methyltransferase, TrmH family